MATARVLHDEGAAALVLTGLVGHEPIDVSDARWTAIFQDVLLGTTRVVEHALPHLATTQGTSVTTAPYSIRAPEIARLSYASLEAGVTVFTEGIAKAYGAQGTSTSRSVGPASPRRSASSSPSCCRAARATSPAR